VAKISKKKNVVCGFMGLTCVYIIRLTAHTFGSANYLSHFATIVTTNFVNVFTVELRYLSQL
jgi:hypothetical protein